ncbi:PAQR family membrane homeostasis protein TrhA [Actinorhabdospora filicis]|uniref:PAQR family membrane homeostasis protein TrhA n=1 Tax=Actinorhabdospora filicis TaxID=1785913 RepID=UPI002554AF89|nr:hemolysin III family protein [Actinorhabdospora filicis]
MTDVADVSDAAGPVEAKPRWRGALHALTFPAVLVAGLFLVALGPTVAARVSSAIYVLTSASLFGVSGWYHRATVRPRTGEALRRADHANIYLIIAGTYTPFAVLALSGGARILLLAIIWGGAVAGVVFRVVWIGAPRWLYTSLYVALGWTAVFFLPQLLPGAGVLSSVLVFGGGILYSLGGLVYGLRRPDPSPRWFGFHEVFHAFTVAAYISQFAGVALLVARS